MEKYIKYLAKIPSVCHSKNKIKINMLPSNSIATIIHTAKHIKHC